MLRSLKNVILKEEFLACSFSAILLILSFPNFDLWFFAWFGFVPLFFALKGKSKMKAFLLAYFTGVIFWTGIIYWLVHVTLPGTILLILYLALYFGIFGLIISRIVYRVSSSEQLLIACAWVLLEYVRAYLFTGFPWTPLGYSQYLNLPVIQISDITGSWGVSFLVMLINAAIYSAIGHKLSAIKRKQFLLPILIIFITLIYGYFKIHHSPFTIHHSPLRISVIQGNIPQELKWIPESEEYIIEKYLSLTRLAAKDKPDLIVWPEAALPVVLEEEPRFFARTIELVKEIKIPLLLGTVTFQDNLYYNSAVLISPGGQILNRYDKLHLVPFGEYIPLKKILSFLETIVPIGDIMAGKEYTVFASNTTRFSALICFEDLFPELSRRFVKYGANFLINITNDAWYKRTSAPWQHLQASVFRAVENRVPLIRAANTGISGFITCDGKIISLVENRWGRNIFIDGYATKEIFFSRRPLTFYTRYGDVFILLLLIFSLYSILYFNLFLTTKRTE